MTFSESFQDYYILALKIISYIEVLLWHSLHYAEEKYKLCHILWKDQTGLRFRRFRWWWGEQYKKGGKMQHYFLDLSMMPRFVAVIFLLRVNILFYLV